MAASSSSSPSPPAEDADGHCADYALFSDALRHFADRQHELDSSLKSSQRSLDLQFASHDALLKQCAAQWAEYARLQAMQRDLRAELSKEEKAAMRERLEEDQITMEMAKQELDMWRQAKPGNQSSIFLRIVLGRVNVQLWKKTDRIEFKDAYNRFKRDTTAIFLIFPLVQLLLSPHRVLFQLHQLWLLYYYFTLSLRENILYANGSSMKLWWIYHHYVSICITLLILLYPDDFCHPLRHTRLMLFGLAQGAVMLCQFLYQSKRSYVRKTLGKAKSIDVDATETLVEKPTDLKWLVPILYSLYLYEGYIGVDVLSRFLQEGKKWGTGELEGRPWHLVSIGLGCLVLAVGNTITTSLVLVSKQKLRHWTKLIRSRATSAPHTPQPAAPAPASAEGHTAAEQAVDGKAEKQGDAKEGGKDTPASAGKDEAVESKADVADEEDGGGAKPGKAKLTRRRHK